VGMLRWEDDSGRTPTPGCKSRRREGDGGRTTTVSTLLLPDDGGRVTAGRRWRKGEHERGSAAWGKAMASSVGSQKLPSKRSVLASRIQRLLDPKFRRFFSNYTYPQFYRASWRCSKLVPTTVQNIATESIRRTRGCIGIGKRCQLGAEMSRSDSVFILCGDRCGQPGRVSLRWLLPKTCLRLDGLQALLGALAAPAAPWSMGPHTWLHILVQTGSYLPLAHRS